MAVATAVSKNSPTIADLRRIWEQVFGRAPIGLSDNFYDLGGNADSADAICSAIATLHGCELPAAAISQAPTIAQLASLLAQNPLPKLSPLIEIKPGTLSQAPIFIAHGLSGMVEFYKLAKHIHSAHPIYGIQARGLDGREEPFDRLEDMADYYLQTLVKTHVASPYLLIGYSFGGLVALEIAQRLLRQGSQVAMLALIDTYPHARFMPAPLRARLSVRRMKHHASSMLAMPVASAFSYLTQGVRRKLHRAALVDTAGENGAPDTSLAATMPRVNRRAYRAFYNYQPQFYPGPIKFVTTEVQTFFPGNPEQVWKRLTNDFKVKKIPGDHLNIVSTEYRPLGEVLTRFVEESDPTALG